MPFRPAFYNVPLWAQITLYAVTIVALAIFGYGIWRHARLWRPKHWQDWLQEWGVRLRKFVMYGSPGQKRLWRQLGPGTFHAGIMWGFIVLLIGTILATADYELGVLLMDRHLLRGTFYLVYELALDMFGLLFSLALLAAMYRRYILRPSHTTGRWGFALWSLLIVNVSGFVVEGYRLLLQQPAWARWSPIGYLTGQVLQTVGLGGSIAEQAHQATWLLHMVAGLGFLALLPYSDIVHAITASLNIFFSSAGATRPAGAALASVNLDQKALVGVGTVDDFTWKQRLGFDACTRCGRCTAVCPATEAGSALDPQELITLLAKHMQAPLSANGVGEQSILHGHIVRADALWACTTCMACVEACPVFIDIVDDIVDLRRYLVHQGQVPISAARALENMWQLGSAWAQPLGQRADRSAQLGLQPAKPGTAVELLYWVGDTSVYDEEARSIPMALAAILIAADVQPATLAGHDGSDGEAARRLGEEALFQTVAQHHIQRLEQVKPRRMVTHCPHSYNSFLNEYPELDGTLPVLHHSQLLLELLGSGRLEPAWPLRARVTYHDPCYLGRYNSEYSAPRQVLHALPEVDLVEMSRSRENAFCCGGGGGRMWLDVESPRRINHLRFQEAEQLGVDVIATACPYCKIMLNEAATYKDSPVQVKDIAELLLETLASDATNDAG